MSRLLPGGPLRVIDLLAERFELTDGVAELPEGFGLLIGHGSVTARLPHLDDPGAGLN